MILLARLTLVNRVNPIRTRYRPDWRSDRKPDLNGAQVTFATPFEIFPGDVVDVQLQPMVPDLWDVRVGDILRGYEGFKQTCSAEVLKITS